MPFEKTEGAPRFHNGTTGELKHKNQERIRALKVHLVEYLGLKSPEEAERILFVIAADLDAEFGDQFRFLGDNRLRDTLIAIVPDALWIKGHQPSESSAERGLILFKQKYFEGEKDARDQIAWMAHELAHRQRYLDRSDNYRADSETPAFDDIDLKTYPNNKIEEHAFSRQLSYLRSRGVDRSTVAKLLEDYYGPEEFIFLNRILNKIYKE